MAIAAAVRGDKVASIDLHTRESQDVTTTLFKLCKDEGVGGWMLYTFKNREEIVKEIAQ